MLQKYQRTNLLFTCQFIIMSFLKLRKFLWVIVHPIPDCLKQHHNNGRSLDNLWVSKWGKNLQQMQLFNSLVPGRLKWDISWVIFKPILVINGLGVSREIALRWMSYDFTDHKSTLVQVMAWCRQATSHDLSQCWPRFMLPYDVTRPQWVNSLSLGDAAVILTHRPLGDLNKILDQ